MRSALGSIAFLALIFGVPVAQAVHEQRTVGAIQVLDVAGPLDAPRLRAFEEELRTASLLHRYAAPWYQWLLLQLTGRGNEKATFGRDQWLFLGDDLDVLTQRTDATAAAAAILDVRDQLARANVELLVVAVPPKAACALDHYSAWTQAVDHLQSPAVRDLFATLERNAVHFVDAGTVMRSEQAGDLFLRSDTHWTPAAMASVAQATARAVRELTSDIEEHTWGRVKTHATGSGDLAGMLRVPPGKGLATEETVVIQRTVDRRSGAPFEALRSAPILLLGDSFTRVFSDPQLGFGVAAGFAEHVAWALQTDLDVIAIPGGSARAVRETVALRPQGALDKTLVIWQISLRELAAAPASWAAIDLTGSGVDETATQPQASLNVVAEVLEVTRVPASFDYEFCLAITEYRVVEVETGQFLQQALWVAEVALDDGQATPAADRRVGERRRMLLEPLAQHYDLEQTAWVDDTDMRKPLSFAVSSEAVER